jgi:hypothetical protein
VPHSASGRPPVFLTGNDGSIPSCATKLRFDAGSSSGRTLDFESGYGRSNRSPATSSLIISKFPLRPMEGRCALNARSFGFAQDFASRLRRLLNGSSWSPREGAGAMVYRQDS